MSLALNLSMRVRTSVSSPSSLTRIACREVLVLCIAMRSSAERLPLLSDTRRSTALRGVLANACGIPTGATLISADVLCSCV